jgi:hypothetical protein
MGPGSRKAGESGSPDNPERSRDVQANNFDPQRKHVDLLCCNLSRTAMRGSHDIDGR